MIVLVSLIVLLRELLVSSAQRCACAIFTNFLKSQDICDGTEVSGLRRFDCIAILVVGDVI